MEPNPEPEPEPQMLDPALCKVGDLVQLSQPCGSLAVGSQGLIMTPPVKSFFSYNVKIDFGSGQIRVADAKHCKLVEMPLQPTAEEPEPQPEAEAPPEPDVSFSLDPEMQASARTRVLEPEPELEPGAQTSALGRGSLYATVGSVLEQRRRAAREHPRYVDDAETETCMLCGSPFGIMTSWKHHCRYCGWVVCGGCSSHTLVLDRRIPVGGRTQTMDAEHKLFKQKEKRVCDSCFQHAPGEMTQRKDRAQLRQQRARLEEQRAMDEEKAKLAAERAKALQAKEQAEAASAAKDAAKAALRHQKALAKAERDAAKAAEQQAAKESARLKAEHAALVQAEARSLAEAKEAEAQAAELRKIAAESERLTEAAQRQALADAESTRRLKEEKLAEEKIFLAQAAVTTEAELEVARKKAEVAKAKEELAAQLHAEKQATSKAARLKTDAAKHQADIVKSERKAAEAQRKQEKNELAKLAAAEEARRVKEVRLAEERKHLEQAKQTAIVQTQVAREKQIVSEAQAAATCAIAAEKRAAVELARQKRLQAELEEAEAKEERRRQEAKAAENEAKAQAALERQRAEDARLKEAARSKAAKDKAAERQALQERVRIEEQERREKAQQEERLRQEAAERAELARRVKRSQQDQEAGLPARPTCDLFAQAELFLRAAAIDTTYLDPRHNRCYCAECYRGWETIANEGPTPYVVPKGWYRFGLDLGPRAHAKDLDIFKKWSASFHGVTSIQVLKSILNTGQLMKAGDELLEPHPAGVAGCHKPGCRTLHSTKCAGRQDSVFYTSPTIKYAGLKFYAVPQRYGEGMAASIVLQCRQKPSSMTTQAETMGFKRNWPGLLPAHCPHVNLEEIEWMSKANAATIPYGLLIRPFKIVDESLNPAYCSPVDRPCAWLRHEAATMQPPSWCAIGKVVLLRACLTFGTARRPLKAAEVASIPDQDGRIEVKWSHGVVLETRLPVALMERELTGSDLRQFQHEKDVYSWCKIDAVVKQNQSARVGVVIMDPDGDGDVKVRWHGGEVSNYVQAVDFVRASTDDQRRAVSSWCKKNELAKTPDGKVGVILTEPDHNAKVRLGWAANAEQQQSSLIKAVTLQPASAAEQADFVKWCKEGVFVKHVGQGRIGIVQGAAYQRSTVATVQWFNGRTGAGTQSEELVVTLRLASIADQKSLASWCKEGVTAKVVSELPADRNLKGKIGVIDRVPDRDAEVKLKWIADDALSGYVRAVKLCLATADEVQRAKRCRTALYAWCKEGEFAKQRGTNRVGIVHSVPDAEGNVSIWLKDRSLCSARVQTEAVAQLSVADVGDQIRDCQWCRKDVAAKAVDQHGEWKVGTITMNPDSDAEVKLRWHDGSGTSRYIRVVKLLQLTDSEQATLDDAAIAWCQKGTIAIMNGRVGVVVMDPDSDREVKVAWCDGEQSGYLKASTLAKASIDDQKRAALWCKTGVGAKAKQNGEWKVGTITMDPDRDAEVKLRWNDGSESGYIGVVHLRKLSSSETRSLQRRALEPNCQGRARGGFFVGQRVQCRDAQKEWKSGIVTEFDSEFFFGKPKVQVDGWDKAYSWDECKNMYIARQCCSMPLSSGIIRWDANCGSTVHGAQTPSTCVIHLRNGDLVYQCQRCNERVYCMKCAETRD